MRQEIPEIKLDLPANTAQKVKFTFYAFIRALEVSSGKKLKLGDMTGAGELELSANAMRKYLVDIQINGTSVTQIRSADQTSCVLRFINRDLNPMTKSMREQVKEQLIYLRDVPALDKKPLVVPSVDSFFTKPLEIDDDRDKGTDGGVPTNKPTN